MTSDGLDTLTVKIDSNAVRVVNDDLRRDDRVARLSAFLRMPSDPAAFQNDRDEGDMGAACAGFAGADFHIEAYTRSSLKRAGISSRGCSPRNRDLRRGL